MEKTYWHQKWDDEKIGFHQSDVNKRLVQYWPTLSLSASRLENCDKGCVFVPLCGKSLDMVWLHQQGHAVLGVELSGKAAQAFFNENQLSVVIRHEEQFTVYEGTGEALGITIMVGDFFDLTPADCKSCVALYDRAAMIAMENDIRVSYASHLATLMPALSQGLLLTISYDQSQMQGPPFSVSDENVKKLLTDSFTIKELVRYSGPERLGNLKDRGLETLDERVYLLKRVSTL